MVAELQRSGFVRGFVEKVLSYALGRPVGATDRGTIDEIIASMGPAEKMQSLIQAVVASAPFQMK